MSEALRRVAGDRWLAENREAVGYGNSDIETHGVFSDGLRRF